MSDEAERLYERLLVLRCQTGDEDAYRELVGSLRSAAVVFLAQARVAESIGPMTWRRMYGSTCCGNCRG